MAISKTSRKLSCIGNGSADTFNFPFKVLDKSNFTLILTNINGDDTVLTVDTDYSLTGIGEDSGVIVTYPLNAEVPKLATGEKLTGYRSTDITQLLDFMYGGGFSPRIHENAFDKITMILQEFSEELERRPMLPITVTASNITDWVKNIALIDGSNINRFAFLSALGIGVDGELDISDFSKTSGTNIDVASYRSLLGIDDLDGLIEATGADLTYIESATLQTSSSTEQVAEFKSLLGIDEVAGLTIRPQTIVAGDTAYPVFGCDPLAKHLTYSDAELTVHSGLQVAAGVNGATVLSNELATDTVLSMSAASDCTCYIHATLNDSKDLEIGYTEKEPELGISRKGSLVKITPDMTSNSAPSGYLVTASEEYSGRYAWYAFNGVIDATFASGWQAGTSKTGWIQIQLPTPQPLDVVTITAPNDDATRAPNALTILGSSGGSTWETAIDVTGLEWGAGESKSFELPATMNYDHYKISGACDAATYLNIAEIQLFRKIVENDFYNVSSHSHYDLNGDSISRVYIGECTVSSGVIADVINYQHGTIVTMPVNNGANIAVNSTYFLDKPYPGECSSKARLFVDGKWGAAGWLYTSAAYGTTSNITDGVLSVVTGANSIGTKANDGGSELAVQPTSALAKVTAERSW